MNNEYANLLNKCYEQAKYEAMKQLEFAKIGRTEPLPFTDEAACHFAEIGAEAACRTAARIIRESIHAQRPMNPNDKKRTLDLVTPPSR